MQSTHTHKIVESVQWVISWKLMMVAVGSVGKSLMSGLLFSGGWGGERGYLHKPHLQFVVVFVATYVSAIAIHGRVQAGTYSRHVVTLNGVTIA